MKRKLLIISLLAVAMMVALVLVACNNTVTAKFSGGEGATGTPPQSITANAGEQITLPDNTFTKTGYKFAGWYDGYSTYQEGASYELNENVTFKALWEEDTPPVGGDEHTCEHVCNTCQLCTDMSCNDDVCKPKCQGHDVAPHECESKCATCNKCTNKTCGEQVCRDKCQGHSTQPAAPGITGLFNGYMTMTGKNSAGKDVAGEMYLMDDGTGSIDIYLASNGDRGMSLAVGSLRYTVNNGTLTVTSLEDTNLRYVSGTIVDQTVTIVVQYKPTSTNFTFVNTLARLTTVNMQGNGETNVNYYPEGTQISLAGATVKGYVLKEVVVNGNTKPASWLNTFTTLTENTEVQFIWEVVELGHYTIIYRANNGTNQTYTDTSTSSTYKLLSIHAASGETSKLGFTIPEGKVFGGWLVNGQVKGLTDTITLTSDTTEVVAQWAGNVTVTLNGLDASGVSHNLERFEWNGSTREMGPAEASRFYLPYGTLMSTHLSCERSGFVLTGWTCSVHEGVTHTPGANHPITEDTTFTAQWKLDIGTTNFEGTYTATTPLDISMLSGDSDEVFVKAVVAGSKVTLYSANGYSKASNTLTFTGNTATGTLGTYQLTLTLDGSTLTISVKRGNGDPQIGIFILQS